MEEDRTTSLLGQAREAEDRRIQQETVAQLGELNKTLIALKDELREINVALGKVANVIGTAATMNQRP